MVGLIVGGAIWASVTLAPNYTPVDTYIAHWEQQELTIESIQEYRRVLDTMPGAWFLPEEAFIPEPPAQVISFPQGVEQWRSLVEVYFQPKDVAWAMRVMQCESQGRADAQNSRSSAGGLFQFIDSTWAFTPYSHLSKYDPEANIAAAAWLYYKEGPKHWACK